MVVSTAPGTVLLRPVSAVCEGCSGCAGRCGLFAGESQQIALPVACVDGVLDVGEGAILSLDPDALRREALRGYGRPLLGLLLGAALGAALASLFLLDANLTVAVSSALGTLAGLGGSKRGLASACRARPAGPLMG